LSKIKIANLLSRVEKPSRYLGLEVNSVHKPENQVGLRAVLAFPDLYEVGMSHLGTQILYGTGNSMEGVQVERVFLPHDDMLDLLSQNDLPLCTLESRTPLLACDLVGFTLQSELTFTSILTILDSGGIPIYAAERDEEMPIVIAGGPCAFNPEPLYEFFDLFLLGDGEEQWSELLAVQLDCKKRGLSRRDTLLAISEQVSGIYDPDDFEVKYGNDGSPLKITSRTGVETVERAQPVSIEEFRKPSAFIVPFLQPVHDRINIEASRGCTRGCRFCHAGMIYRPVRERTSASILSRATNALKITGYEDVSLNSLSIGDYGPLDEVLNGLMDQHEGERIAVSLPSMRVGTLTPGVARQILRVRKTGFTIAPEAGTERLRRVINKDISDESILQTAKWVFANGWNAIKLYFMIGLPTETDDDIAQIITLAKRIASLAPGSGQVTVSLSPFVPKAHTPFQWVPQEDEPELRRKLNFLRDNLNGKKIQVRWGRTDQALLEAILARGDRRLSPVITAAWKSGANRDGWDECFKWDLWKAAFDECEIDPDWYAYRERGKDEMFPWDHISCGVSREFLYREYIRGLEGDVTPDCREAGCRACGACVDDQEIHLPPLREVSENGDSSLSQPEPEQPEKPVRRIRVIFSKKGDLRFIGHLETMRVFERAARRANIPLSFTGGYHPKPRITFALSLPMTVEGGGEWADFELSGSISADEFAERINGELPSGINIVRAWKAPLEGQALTSRLSALDYSATLPDFLNGLAKTAHEFMLNRSVVIERKRKGKIRNIELMDYLQDLKAVDERTISFALAFKGTEGSVRPQEVLLAVLGKDTPDMADVRIVRTGIRLRLEDGKSGGRPAYSRIWD